VQLLCLKLKAKFPAVQLDSNVEHDQGGIELRRADGSTVKFKDDRGHRMGTITIDTDKYPSVLVAYETYDEDAAV
jgi:hypothetical protein